MNISAPLLVALSLGLLAGCQTSPEKSQAMANVQRINERFAQANQAASECAQSIQSLPATQLVAQQVIFLSQDNPNQSMLMVNQSRLSQPQKNALNEYLSAHIKCKDPFVQAIQGLPYQPAVERYLTVMDGIYKRLLSGDMTIGEANTIKLKAIQDTSAEIAAAKAVLDTIQ